MFLWSLELGAWSFLRSAPAMLGEKFENARFVRLANAALGDKAGHELAWCNVEAEICGGTIFRSDADFDVSASVESIGMTHFFGAAFFDGNFMNAIANGPIERRRGQRNVKRNGVILRGERLEIGADLVGYVTGVSRPVGPDHHGVHFAALHQMPAGVVRDDGVWNAVLAEFPCG